MKIGTSARCFCVLIIVQTSFAETFLLEMKEPKKICYIWQDCWWKKAGKDIEKEFKKIGRVFTKVGQIIGNITIKAISKKGEVTIDIGGKAGNEILKTGQSMVTSAGMTLLNAGGMIVALTTGDIKNIKSCAKAVSASSMYGLSTVVDESLKAVGTIDHLIQIDSISLEGSSSELALQGRLPKFSIKGSFLKKQFVLNDVQLDLSNPDKFILDLLDALLKLQ
jgi:hypothetical protein